MLRSLGAATRHGSVSRYVASSISAVSGGISTLKLARLPRRAALLDPHVTSSSTFVLRASSSQQLPIRTLHSSCMRLGKAVMVPSMGDSITEGTVASLVKRPGDTVAEDEVLALLETDKVTVEIRSPVAGVVVSFNVKPGDTVQVGAQIATIEGSTGASAKPSAAPSSKPATQTAAPPSPPSSPSPPSPPSSSSSSSTSTGGAPKPAAAAAAGQQHHHTRQPMIRFRYGKVDRSALHKSHAAPSTGKGSTTTSNAGPWNWDMSFEPPARYRRAPLSAQEIAVIELGGAIPDPAKSEKAAAGEKKKK